MTTDVRATAARMAQAMESGEINTNQLMSLAGGALLVGLGLSRRGLIGLGMAAFGGRMLYRTFQDLQYTLPQHGTTGPIQGPNEPAAPMDRVDEASWESFPASDAPATY